MLQSHYLKKLVPLLLTAFISTSFIQSALASPTTKAIKKQTVESSYQTIIFPVKYLDGSKMANILKAFIPRKERRYTRIRYSRTLHKLLIQAKRKTLQKLKAVSEQIDKPQAQFRVLVYFVKPASQPNDAIGRVPNLRTYLKKAYPLSKEFTLQESVYLQATNHAKAEVKITKKPEVTQPSLRLEIHQANEPKAMILLKAKITHHEPFSSVNRTGTNTSFIVATQLETKVIVKSGAYTLLGTTPLRRSGSGNEKVIVVIKIKRLSSTSTQAVKPQKKATLAKHQIQKVIRRARHSFKYCYEKALLQQPKLQGKVTVSFSIISNGRTKDIVLKKSTLSESSVENCILKRFRRLRFPEPTGSGIVRVTYPLKFAPK